MAVTSVNQYADMLRKIPQFAEMDDSLRFELSQHCSLRRLEKGSVVFREGECPQALHYLVAGQVKRSVCNPDGDEKVIEVFRPRQLVGDAELFSERICQSRAEATCDGVLLSIGRDALFAVIAQRPEIALRLLKSLADRHYALEQDIVSRRFQSSADRVLDYLCERATEDARGDTALVHLGTSKRVMASHLDMSPETLSRSLRRLINAELISVQGRRVHIYLSALAAYQRSGEPSEHSCAGRPSQKPNASSMMG